MIYELRKQIDYFLRNKIYMVSLIIAAVAGYGYEITHSSLGIDDVCSNSMVCSVKVYSWR